MLNQVDTCGDREAQALDRRRVGLRDQPSLVHFLDQRLLRVGENPMNTGLFQWLVPPY